MREPILITGASGFVGRHVVERARRRGLQAVASSGDLREPEAVREAFSAHRPGAVVHLASSRHRDGGPWASLQDELAMLANVLSATADTAPGAPVLIAGSASQYGLARPSPLPESASMEPVGDYGAVKCVLERAALLGPLAKDVRVIWARSFNLFGPGQGREAPVASWACQIAMAEHRGSGRLRTGDLGVVRDFLDVRDLADAYLALLDSEAHGAVNVGSGRPVRLQEIVDGLLGAANAEIAVERDAALDRPLDPPYVVADVTRLRELTGWQPAVGLRQSLQDVLEDWRERVVGKEVALCAP